jgi:hypothetical protein
VPGSSFAPEQSENMSVGRSPPSGGPSQTVPGERPTVAPGGVPNNEGKEHERHDQLQKYGGNVVGVELSGCCYELLARSLGAYGERVATTDELRGALKRAIERVPSVLEVLVTRDAVSADFTGGLAGVPDRQALRLGTKRSVSGWPWLSSPPPRSPVVGRGSESGDVEDLEGEVGANTVVVAA